MQNTNSRFVANIVGLQNVISNTSGLDATTQLSNAIGNIQQMINFDTKTVYTNYLGAFTQDGSINVTSPINLCNVGITSNDTPIATSSTSNIPLTPNLVSTVEGIGSLGYISSIPSKFISSLSNVRNISSVQGNFGNILASSIYTGSIFASSISTQSLTVFGANTLTVQGNLFSQTLFLPNITDGSYIPISVQDGSVLVNGAVPPLNNDSIVNLTSTLEGLGSANYISSFDMASTLAGLGTSGYVSSSFLFSNIASTIIGLGSDLYISSLNNVVIVSSMLGNFSTVQTPNLFANSIGINSISPQYTLDVNGEINASGQIYVNGQAVLVSGLPSDRRIKENITPITHALEKIQNLQGIYYNRKDSENKTRKIGFIAQEVEEVVPEVILTDSSKDKYKSIEYQNLTALLVQGIKEEVAEFSTFKATFYTLATEHSTLQGNFIYLQSTVIGKYGTI